MDGATGAVDDLDFAIDASKFDDLEYIKANPLSEKYYLSDEEIRYRQFWRRVEEGRNVMPEDEYAKWMYSDSKVGDYLTIEEVDYDDILSLRKSEQMSQTIDDTASVKKIIGSEGGTESFLGRSIDLETESSFIGTVKDFRSNLTARFKKSGNVAVADVNIEGISKNKFFAHSRIDDAIPESLIGKIDDISLKPQKTIYSASMAEDVNGISYLRDSCTEYKIINEIAAELGNNTSVSGKIKLFTEKPPCESCQKIFAQFAQDYPNIKIEIIHNDANMIKP